MCTMYALTQWCPNKNLKGAHSMGAKNSSIQNVWKILRPKGPVGPAGPVMDNTALTYSVECRVYSILILLTVHQYMYILYVSTCTYCTYVRIQYTSNAYVLSTELFSRYVFRNYFRIRLLYRLRMLKWQF